MGSKNLAFKCDFPEQMFQMAHLLMMENKCANCYWNPSKIVRVLVQTKVWSLSVTLTLGLPEQLFQMAHLHMMENNNFFIVLTYFEIHPQL